MRRQRRYNDLQEERCLNDRALPVAPQDVLAGGGAEVDLAPRLRPVQRRSRNTVETILDAATELLEERGVDGFNTNALAERAGVAVRSVYRYFPNKLAVIVELVNRQHRASAGLFDEALRVLADPGEDAFRSFCRLVEDWGNYLSGAPGSQEIRRAMRAVPELRARELADRDIAARRIAEAVQRRGTESSIDRIERSVRLCVTAFDAIFDDALHRYGEVPREVFDELETMIQSYFEKHLR